MVPAWIEKVAAVRLFQCWLKRPLGSSKIFQVFHIKRALIERAFKKKKKSAVDNK